MWNPLEIVALAWIVFVLVALFHSTPLFIETILKKTENPGFIKRVLLCPKCMGFEISLVLGTSWVLLSDLSLLQRLFAWIILWPSAGGLAWVFHILLFDWFIERRFDFLENEVESLEPEIPLNGRSDSDRTTNDDSYPRTTGSGEDTASTGQN